MAPTGIQQFAVNERALCDHQKLIYECKILKAETWDETNSKTGVLGPHYWVHYKGWKATCVHTYKFISHLAISFIRVTLTSVNNNNNHGLDV